MTTDTKAPRHQYDQPRPGRSYCSVVETDCLAPAGYRSGAGIASADGVRRADLHTCGYCGEPVCQRCSTDYGPDGFACDSHDPAELLSWIQRPRRRTRR